MGARGSLREKARMPRAVRGDEWPLGVWGQSPQLELAFSLEEAPTCGRGSSPDADGISVFPLNANTTVRTENLAGYKA